MGNFTGPPSPGDLGNSPSIPVPDFTSQGQQTAEGWKASGTVERWLVGIVMTIPYAFEVFFEQTIPSILDRVLAAMVNVFTLLQGTNTPGFFVLIGALLEDLLGVPVDAGTIQTAFSQQGARGGLQAVGGAFFDNVTSMLQGAGGMSPDSGIAAAKSWLGFLIEFSVRQGNISFLQSFFPAELFEGVREYGETLEKSLALGRLSRQAFQPLMKILIADPLTWGLNQKYTPTLLGAGPAVRAFNRGLIDNNTFTNELAYAGYSPDRIKALQAESLLQLAAAEVYTLTRWGGLSDQDAIDRLARAGWDRADAETVIQSERAKEADTDVNLLIATVITQRISNFIDAPTFQGIVDGLPIGQTRKDWLKQAAGEKLEFPNRRLSLAEVESAITAGILTLQDLDDWLTAERYDPISHNTLVLLELEKIATQEAKDAVIQYKYNLAVAKAKKKGEPIPPPPPGVAPGT